MAIIEAKNLTKTYRVYRKPRDWLIETVSLGKIKKAREITAIQSVSLSVEQGSTLGIIGHNGAGKSTLLKVLTGLVRPTSGSLAIKGSVMSFLELGSGFHPDFTGRQNVKLNCSILGLSPSEIREQSDEIIAFSELGDAIDDPVRTYSSGMFMRLGFSVAATLKPDELVVDEILSVGDEYFMGKCLDRMNRFKAEGRTIVMVSHDLSLIRQLCDEAVLLRKGAVVATGKPDDVADEYLKSVYETALVSMKPFTDAGENIVQGVRRGSGEIRIIRAEILDESGKPTTVIETGKPFSVSIIYRAEKRMDDILVGFNIFRSDGILFVSTNQRLGGANDKTPKLESGESAQAVFVCPSLNLLKGHYSLGVSVFHGDRPMPMPIDEILGAVKFEIVQGRFMEKGATFMAGEWRMEKLP